MDDDLAGERGQGIQVIARAARVLDVLGGRPEGMSLGGIAKAVDLPRSTVQRIVKALADEELVRTGRADGVRLGPAFLRLVGKLHTDVVAVAAPHLQSLSDDIGETVTLGRISSHELAFIHVVVAERELRVVSRVGANLPLATTAGGRALLALGSDEEALALLQLPDAGGANGNELLKELKRVRRTGYAVDDNETTPGIVSLAVGVDTILGRFAISIPAPAVRVASVGRPRIVEQLLACRDVLLGEIGRSRPDE
ncbi:IclR family transcriptional regulator [Paraburkholderia sp. BCC1885]|uniref:IclR family transcriptional regulator n=1 Tax=Paraburkholderia sp. BCC1885 TaxID=2562669 RepID=UPI00118434B0|nr:IclR family transcriptional regulator [Paraburkholderia sp. BCC1885]